jgi:RHS repeat-associated protein
VIYGPGGTPIYQINATGEIIYLHQDHQGSTRLVTNANGTTRGAITYDAHGQITANTNPWILQQPLLGYTGQYHDTETGYIYLRARHYDPTTGQFTSVDPLVSITEEPYGYTGGNPANRADPTGRAFWDDWCIKKGPNDNSCATVVDEFKEDHPEAAQEIVDYSSGALAVNPVTAGTNALGWTDTAQCADEGSGWYKAGVLSMLLVDAAAVPSIGQGGGVVTHWGAESPWVMNGGKSWWNFFKSGMPGRAAYSSGVETSAEGLKLSWPRGIEWLKGFLGQRIVG